nr:immunoglobulin light chain junction region [Macaca mulatta]MOX97290.1 immunoglobulin light chain junction region [Macaca mulatta]MOX97301.1 immunoglobulin light chain junction region [Macaca mulatta]MOX97937.1 immunoglobulin light chain junction region [Macaca mulatta]MOX97939.1 immunoglobulin light chain junction region [Macaca mulatta]
CMQALEFPHSF